MIFISTPESYQQKEALYIAVRDAEDRVVTDEILKTLPYPPANYIHQKEWAIRAKSFERFVRYLPKRSLNILDIGCGNGWMSNRLYRVGHRVTAVDLNITELDQAEKVFGTNNRLQWAYCNIMEEMVINSPFDIIVLSASCQYFDDIIQLTERLKKLLCNKGAIHLLDTFFYKADEEDDARQRTIEYYTRLGYPEMANYYHHHRVDDLKKAGYKKLYPTLLNRTKKPEWWKYSN